MQPPSGASAADEARLAALVRVVHQLELELPYATYDDVARQAQASPELPADPGALRALVDTALADYVLLRDRRQRFDAATGRITPVELLRVNFVHPLVRRALGLEERR